MGKSIRFASIGLICAILLTGISTASVILDRVVAVVNQDVISWSELYRDMGAAAPPQVREMGEEEKNKFFKESEARFLDSLIDERLQLQEARSQNIKVDSSEAQEAMEGIRKKYGMTEEQMKESLKRDGHTVESYKKKLADQIAISRVVNRQVKAKILVSEDDVTKFLNENRKMIDTADSYRISQIFFRMPKNNAAKNALIQKAQMVYSLAKKGDDFKELARKYSEDPTAASGGELGFIKKEDLLQEFREALARIGVGEASMPFWTERGLHIIKLEEKTEIKDQAVLREQARQTLYNKLYSERYKTWLKGLREKSFIEVRL